MLLRHYCKKHKKHYYGLVCPICEKQRRTQERIKKINSQPNFLFVVETKDEETKKYLQEIYAKPEVERKLDIKEDGTVFIRENGKITGVTTIGEICEKLAKEIRKD